MKFVADVGLIKYVCRPIQKGNLPSIKISEPESANRSGEDRAQKRERKRESTDERAYRRANGLRGQWQVMISLQIEIHLRCVFRQIWMSQM